MGLFFRTGMQVQTTSPPFRKGHVIRVAGTGTYSRIYVSLTGWQVVAFYPAQLRII